MNVDVSIMFLIENIRELKWSFPDRDILRTLQYIEPGTDIVVVLLLP